jgi:2-iminobutanoate/2-iminopropanoate deaminase
VPVIQYNPYARLPLYHGYSHATEVRGDSLFLVISGLNGYEEYGISMPESFDGQAELIWKHLKTMLEVANITVRNIISLRIYLACPAFDEQNALMWVKHLEGNRPASKVICCQLPEAKWKLEVEAMPAS